MEEEGNLRGVGWLDSKVEFSIQSPSVLHIYGFSMYELEIKYVTYHWHDSESGR